MPTHRVKLAAPERAATAEIEALLEAGTYTPPDVKQMAETLKLPPKRVLELLAALEREGKAAKVSQDLFYHSSTVARLREQIAERIRARGPLGAAEFRDMIGASRKFSIALLEYFDRTGFTIRVGDRAKAPPGLSARLVVSPIGAQLDSRHDRASQARPRRPETAHPPHGEGQGRRLSRQARSGGPSRHPGAAAEAVASRSSRRSDHLRRCRRLPPARRPRDRQHGGFLHADRRRPVHVRRNLRRELPLGRLRDGRHTEDGDEHRLLSLEGPRRLDPR